jgi:predicted glycosyltransferase
MPHGALGELAEPLQVLRKQSPHTKIVLGLRDILGAPEVIHRQWDKEGAFAAVAEFYDAVLIYGCADVFDAVAEYEFPQLLLDKVQYCGYVCRQNAALESEANGNAHNGEKFILVTGGGGADASFFMDQFIEAARRLSRFAGRFRARITTGPFMHKDQRELLRHKTKDLPIVVSQAGEDSIRYLQRADLVISMAGYNTISEILRFRKNAIVVPRAGPSAEQSMRTRIMSERGLFSTIHPTKLTAENLSALVAEKLGNGHHIHEAMIPNLNGAAKVASVILGA